MNNAGYDTSTKTNGAAMTSYKPFTHFIFKPPMYGQQFV